MLYYHCFLKAKQPHTLNVCTVLNYKVFECLKCVADFYTFSFSVQKFNKSSSLGSFLMSHCCFAGILLANLYIMTSVTHFTHLKPVHGLH